MISGLDLNATVDYSLEDDTEPKTVWKLGVIPSSLYSRILSQLDGTDRIYGLVQACLRGWENFNTSYETEKTRLCGQEVEAVPMRIIDSLSIDVIGKLANKCMELNQLAEAERKN